MRDEARVVPELETTMKQHSSTQIRPTTPRERATSEAGAVVPDKVTVAQVVPPQSIVPTERPESVAPPEFETVTDCALGAPPPANEVMPIAALERAIAGPGPIVNCTATSRGAIPGRDDATVTVAS